MTAQGRTTASRLVVGDRILVERKERIADNGDTAYSTTRKLTGKNGVLVAEVAELLPVHVPFGRVTYLRITTQAGDQITAAPSQTFALAPVEDKAVEAPQEKLFCDACDAVRVTQDEKDVCLASGHQLAQLGYRETVYSTPAAAAKAQAAVDAQPLDATTAELTAAVEAELTPGYRVLVDGEAVTAHDASTLDEAIQGVHRVLENDGLANVTVTSPTGAVVYDVELHDTCTVHRAAFSKESNCPSCAAERTPTLTVAARVHTPFGHTGAVRELHDGCPNDREWLEAQSYDALPYASSTWATVDVDRGGVVCFPVAKLEATDEPKYPAFSATRVEPGRTGNDDVDHPAQRISFGPSLPSSFADAVQALASTIAGGGVIAVRTYTEDSLSELVDYQLRTVTSDPVLTRDGQPHLAVVRCDSDGEPISRAVELIPLDEVHTLHVY